MLGAFVLLLGGAVLISQHALPGDALYGVKRASEDTEYSLAGGAVDRGTLKLEFAARRIGEVGDLLPRATSMAAGSGAVADGGPNADTARLVRETLAPPTATSARAAQQLGGAAVRTQRPRAARGDHLLGAPAASRDAGIVERIPAGRLRRSRRRHPVVDQQSTAAGRPP